MVTRNHTQVIAVAALTLVAGLASSRLTPHEAIGAQTAREMIASGDWLVPRLGGQPWLEKPPLATWLIASFSLISGGVGAWSARLPSAIAAMALCLGVMSIASARLGGRAGLLAGLVQATTPWLILRGRLAEGDVTLAALIVWAFAAFDRTRMECWSSSTGATEDPSADPCPIRSKRLSWAFFALVGATSLVKGVGFGAALVVATVLVVLAWDRDRKTFRTLASSPMALGVGVVIALIWPALILVRYPETLGLWTVHITDRFAARPAHFAGETWTEYLLTAMAHTLPWTFFAAIGAWRSAKRAKTERGGLDRLLWAWLLIPGGLVSLSSTRNSHYLIHALPPLAIWSATSLARVGERLESRIQSETRVNQLATAVFVTLSLIWAVGFVTFASRLHSREAEMAFYEEVARLVPSREPLVLLYDLHSPRPMDKEPYPTPFGPVPADLAARLYALNRPVQWRPGIAELSTSQPPSSFAVIGREGDRPGLSQLGQVESVLRGPDSRWDRSFVLYRVAPFEVADRSANAGR